VGRVELVERQVFAISPGPLGPNLSP
jgi:hypothetical protein